MKKIFQLGMLILLLLFALTLWYTQRNFANNQQNKIQTEFINSARSFATYFKAHTDLLKSEKSIDTVLALPETKILGDIVFIDIENADKNQIHKSLKDDLLNNRNKLVSEIHTENHLIFAYPSYISLSVEPKDSLDNNKEIKEINGIWVSELPLPSNNTFTLKDFAYSPLIVATFILLLFLFAYSPIVLSFSRAQQQVNNLRNKLNEKDKEVSSLTNLVKRNNQINSRNLVFIDEIQKLEKSIDAGTTLLPKLCESIGAVQGICFLFDQKTNKLNAVGGFAVEKDLTELTFSAGEGLIGEAYNTGKINILEAIPENYLQVKSGLGSTTKASMAIVPLISGSKVLGVIELASFTQFDEFDKNFFETISKNLGARLSMLK